MGLLERALLSLVGAVLILGLALASRRRQLPRPPWVLVLLALASWVLLGGGGPELPGKAAQLWLSPVDELLLSFAALRLALWSGLEVPGSLGWWRRPPELLVQLLMVGGGAVITVVVVRQTARVDLVGLVTTSAVLTAVLGFAAQGVLKDLIAGLELQLGDDFGVGDWLDLGGGVQGIVETVSWRDTKLRTMEGARLVVPNSRVTGEVLTNRGAYGAVSNRFDVGLDYSVPPARARELLLEVVQNHSLVLANPEPRVRLKSFGDSAVIYDVHVWQSEPGMRAQVDLRSALLEQIWYAVHRRGWRIPFPVREMVPRQRERSGPPPLDELSPVVLAAIASNHLLSVLSPDQQAELLSGSRPVRFGPGEIIVREGDTGQSLFLLLRGKVAVLKRCEDGSEAQVSELGSGEIFGEMTLLLDAPRSATVKAVAECELLQVNRSCFGELLQRNPHLLDRLADQVEARQAELKTIGSTHARSQKSALLDTMRRLLMDLCS